MIGEQSPFSNHHSPFCYNSWFPLSFPGFFLLSHFATIVFCAFCHDDSGAKRAWYVVPVMSEQTLSFVLKLRVIHLEADDKPLLRGSLVRVGAPEGQHFHSLERLLEILHSSMKDASVGTKMEESKCESQSDASI